MKSTFIAFVISLLCIVEGSNITDEKNKTKRNLSGDLQNYGESNIVWLSSEKHPSVVRHTNTYFSNNARPILVGVQSPLKVYEPKVTADQVQYEFEQAPANPASNLHVKQIYQPANNFNQELAEQTYKPFVQNNSPNDANSNNFNQELAGQTYRSFIPNNAPNVASFNNFNQELAGQTYKPLLQYSSPNVARSNNFNQELAGQTYKPFLHSNTPNVVRSNNYNQESTGPTYRPFLQNNAPNVVGSETIVTPVQHSHLIQNNVHPVHPYANVRVHPLYNVQPQYIGPKKYIYVNGKIILDPNTLHYQNPPTFYHSSQQFPQRQPIINHANNNGVPRQNLVPPLANQPQNRFQAPPQSQMLPIDTPSTAPPKTERQQKRPRQRVEEKPVEEDKDEEDNEEYRRHEDDSDNDEGPNHEKYSFDDEDEDDHNSYRDHEDIEEEDDEEDSNGGSTRYISSKVNKYPKKFNKLGKRDEIIYGSRYEYPEKKYSKDSGKKRRMKFKSYTFSKDSDQYPREGIEGRQSQFIPVTHKQKIFKEKWYISKSSADREQLDE